MPTMHSPIQTRPMFDQKLREQFEIRKVEPTEDAPYVNAYEIYLRGEKMYEWNDNAVVDFAEDLIWRREIGDLFFDAVGIGLHLAMVLFKETLQSERQHRMDEINAGLAKIDALRGIK